MEGEIINRVAGSALEVFDLEDYYPEGKRIELDMAQWLDGGLLLREAAFRQSLKDHDWSQYRDAFVAIGCSTDAILPAWAPILVSTYLTGIAKKVVSGNIEMLNTYLYQEILSRIDYTIYKDKPVIIKGCSKKPVPENAYIIAARHLQPYAKSIMYGEACSAVPLYKKAKA